MSGITDLLRGMLSGQRTSVDPLRVVEQAGSIAAFARAYSTEGPQRLLTELLLPWASKVAAKAPSKWLMSRNLPPVCAIANGRQCSTAPISACHICGRPVCLQHALISVDADVVCWPCIVIAGKHAKKWQPPAAAPPGKDPLAWAYSLLGVEPDCTDADLKKAYKKAAMAYHPDRAGKDVKRAQSDAHLLRVLNGGYAEIVAARKAKEAPE